MGWGPGKRLIWVIYDHGFRQLKLTFTLLLISMGS